VVVAQLHRGRCQVGLAVGLTARRAPCGETSRRRAERQAQAIFPATLPPSFESRQTVWAHVKRKMSRKLLTDETGMKRHCAAFRSFPAWSGIPSDSLIANISPRNFTYRKVNNMDGLDITQALLGRRNMKRLSSAQQATGQSKK